MYTPVKKGISFPFRFDGRGRIATSKFDDFITTKVEESIRVILLTEVRERVMEIGFGTRNLDLVFEGVNSSLDSMAKKFMVGALKRWEPRISIDEEQIDIIRESGKIKIRLAYRVLPVQETKILLVELGDLVG